MSSCCSGKIIIKHDVMLLEEKDKRAGLLCLCLCLCLYLIIMVSLLFVLYYLSSI